jgi:hypothetical protein
MRAYIGKCHPEYRERKTLPFVNVNELLDKPVGACVLVAHVISSFQHFLVPDHATKAAAASPCHAHEKAPAC